MDPLTSALFNISHLCSIFMAKIWSVFFCLTKATCRRPRESKGHATLQDMDPPSPTHFQSLGTHLPEGPPADHFEDIKVIPPEP